MPSRPPAHPLRRSSSAWSVCPQTLSPPLPLSWGSLVQELLLGAHPLTQPLMVAPSPRGPLCSVGRASDVCFAPPRRAPWPDTCGGVAESSTLAVPQLEVLWAERSFGQRGSTHLALWAGGCSVWGKASTSFQGSSPRTAFVFEPMSSSPLEALFSSFA